MDLKFHPYAEIFPLLRGEDFASLVESIRKHGLRDPITLHEDMILDGRNRYRACIEAGVAPAMKVWDGQGRALDFVVDKNLNRRHLSESQRGIAAAEIANMEHGTNRYTNKLEPPIGGSTNGAALVSVAEAAKIMNVGERTVQRATSVITNGTPEMTDAVKAGRLSLHSAEQIIRDRVKKRNEQLNGAPSPAPEQAAPLDNRTRIKVPDGMSMEEAARKGLAMEFATAEREAAIETAAKALGINQQTYRQMREIVLLHQRVDLLPADKKTLQAALDEMNRTNRIGKPYAMIGAIVEKAWGAKQLRAPRTNKKIDQRIQAFVTTIGVTMRACQSASCVEIPYLPEERRKAILSDIKKARKYLAEIENRITGEVKESRT